MALDDKDIFKAICERYSDQPIEYIMAQYEKARRMNMEIEQRSTQNAAQFAPFAPAVEEVVEVVEEATPAKKKYNRRSLAVKPQVSITDDVIYCCICGEQRQSLTAKHLATHGITVEEYKKLCGYPPNQALMSGKRLAKSKEIIARAQKARLDKKSADSDNF